MQPEQKPSHIASLYQRRRSGGVLSLKSKLMFSAMLMLMPLGFLLLALVVLAVERVLLPGRAGMLDPIIVLVAVLGLEVMWARAYPEWPLNQILAWRLRRSLRSRYQCPDQAWIDSARMVEWVPRENWCASKLDTAQDVMLVRIDNRGLQLEGDRYRIEIPADSILHAQLESTRPGGCFHQLFFINLVVRTQIGPIEIPLSLRDHGLGHLRAASRKRENESLCQSIQNIATANEFALTNPYDGGAIFCDHPHDEMPAPASAPKSEYSRKSVLSTKSGSTSSSVNPYQAPRGAEPSIDQQVVGWE